MKKRSRIPVIAVLTLLSAATLWAQSLLITNPANLSQFPSVERIRIATKGTDDVDSHARFMAALWRINDMIFRDLVTAPNGGMYTVPPAADQVRAQYAGALTRYGIDQMPPAARDPRFRPLEAKYEKDPAFFDGLLTQFFSPKFRTDYYAWIRKPVPTQTAAMAAAGTKGSSPDPSIAKAKAFKMDTSVFGMELGQPLSLPSCGDIPRNCVYDSNASQGGLFDWITTMVPNATAPTDPNVMLVSLDNDHCPSWIWVGCQAEILMHDGVLVAVSVSTKGRKVEKSVNAELKAKYGAPNLVQHGKITPDVGNAYEVNDPLWFGRGIRVEYQVVLHNEDVGVDTSHGWVRVITETAYDRLNKPVKKKM